MRIFLTNLGKYNEGSLVGEWLKLPYTIEELNAALQRIGIAVNGRHEEYFITDYENDLGLKVGEYESLSELNEVAKYVESLKADEVRLLRAVIELEGVDVSRTVDVIRSHLISMIIWLRRSHLYHKRERLFSCPSCLHTV